jgi:hypothetical protein
VRSKAAARGKAEGTVGSGPTRHHGSTAADALLAFVSVCEGMLADDDWLASHPEWWRSELVALRDRLNDELAERARAHAEPG